MSKQIPLSIQAATESTFSALIRTPFAKVAISTLVLENVFRPVRALTQHLYSWSTFPLLLTPLHHQWLTSSIQFILSAAGFPGCYTGHKLCSYFSSLLWLTRSLHRHA